MAVGKLLMSKKKNFKKFLPNFNVKLFLKQHKNIEVIRIDTTQFLNKF